jgi:hypothetical protein
MGEWRGRAGGGDQLMVVSPPFRALGASKN